MIPAASDATSVPEPKAIPTSAAARAAASLTPSPTMATRRPSCLAFATRATLSAGLHAALTRLMPTSAATTPATSAASPVRSSLSMPRDFNVFTACTDDGRVASEREIRPAIIPSTATPTRVSLGPASAPCFTTMRASAMPWPSRNAMLPITTSCSSTRAVTPPPRTMLKAEGMARSIESRRARASMARAIGCVENCSAAAASARSWASL